MSETTSSDGVRTGSYVDLARRVDRLEASVAGLTSTVQAIELNQKHAETVNGLHFAALNTGIENLGKTVDGFMTRVEGIISGEIQTVQSRAGQELVSDYKVWRGKVDSKLPTDVEETEFRAWKAKVDTHLEDVETVINQIKFLGTLVRLLVAGNVIAIFIAGVSALSK